MSTRFRLVAVLVMLAVFAISPVAQAVDNYLFWGEYFTGNIKRFDLDSSAVTTIATGQGTVWGVAADNNHDRVYWALLGSPSLSNIRGSNFNDFNVITEVQTLSRYGEGITVHPVTENVYFNYYLSGGTPATITQGINYAQGDGSQAPTGATHLIDHNNSGDTALALDIPNGHIYESRGAQIYRGSLGGGTMTAMPNVVTINSFGIALDLVNQKMYWSSYSNTEIGWIKSANMDGTGGTTTVLSDVGVSVGMAIDPYSGTLYFNLDGNSNYARGIYSVPLGGGTPTQVLALSSHPRGLAIAVPEPASLSLLALGGLLTLRRRR